LRRTLDILYEVKDPDVADSEIFRFAQDDIDLAQDDKGLTLEDPSLAQDGRGWSCAS